MKNHQNIKLPIPLAAIAASCLMLQACAGGETMLVGALVVHPVTLAASTVAMPVAADSAAHTGLFDGLATPKAKQEEYAKLDQAAEELSAQVGARITRNDVKLLAVLDRRGQAGLREFARDSKLTRTEVMDAVARLEALHLIWLDHHVTESGPFTAALTPKGTLTRMPVARLFVNPEFLTPGSNRNTSEQRIASAGVPVSHELN